MKRDTLVAARIADETDKRISRALGRRLAEGRTDATTKADLIREWIAAGLEREEQCAGSTSLPS